VAWRSQCKIPAHLGPTFRSKQRVTSQSTEVLTAAMERDDHGGIGDCHTPVQPYDRGRTSFEVQRQRQKRVTLSSRGEFRLASLCNYSQMALVNASR
jgi:beta-lactamase class D